MKLWLTRQHNRSYMLSRDLPIIATVRGTRFDDAYVRPSDPVGFRNMCEGFAHTLWMELEPLESTQVEVTGKVITDKVHKQ